MSRHSRTDAAWKAQRKRVLDRDGHTCQACGVHLTGERNAPDSPTVDHVQAIALDPDRVYRDDELLAMCRRCNGRKSDKALVRQDWFSEDWFEGKVPL